MQRPRCTISRTLRVHGALGDEPSVLALDSQLQNGQHVGIEGGADRLVTVVLTTSDFDRSVEFYGNVLGLDLHVDDHDGDDEWTSGRHAATSWTDGAFMHFAIYETKDGSFTAGIHLAFRVGDIVAAHRRVQSAGVDVVHAPKPQPWGTSARYRDHDGNVIELTQPS